MAKKFLHILVADNEPAICDMLSALLQDLGYRVSTAHDGIRARAIMTGSDVDLLVSDELVVGGPGDELAAYAKSRGIATLLMSGAPKSMIALIGGPQGFISPSFKLEEFDQKLQEILAEPHGDANGV